MRAVLNSNHCYPVRYGCHTSHCAQTVLVHHLLVPRFDQNPPNYRGVTTFVPNKKCGGSHTALTLNRYQAWDTTFYKFQIRQPTKKLVNQL